jgi:hypothetical protein
MQRHRATSILTSDNNNSAGVPFAPFTDNGSTYIAVPTDALYVKTIKSNKEMR